MADLELVKLGESTKTYINKINEAIRQINSNADEIEDIEQSLDSVGKVQDVKVNGSSVLDGTTRIASVPVPTAMGQLTNNNVYIPTAQKGANSGVASLGSDGKIPSSQLPSFVDDIVEYTTDADFNKTGEAGKIYIDLRVASTSYGKIFKWNGSSYAVISDTLKIGTEKGTAYAGDKGKADAENIASINANYISIDQSASSIPPEEILIFTKNGTRTVKSSGKRIVSLIENTDNEDNVPTDNAVLNYTRKNTFRNKVVSFDAPSVPVAAGKYKGKYTVFFPRVYDNYSHSTRPVSVVNDVNQMVFVDWTPSDEGWYMITDIPFEGTAFFMSRRDYYVGGGGGTEPTPPTPDDNLADVPNIGESESINEQGYLYYSGDSWINGTNSSINYDEFDKGEFYEGRDADYFYLSFFGRPTTDGIFEGGDGERGTYYFCQANEESHREVAIPKSVLGLSTSDNRVEWEDIISWTAGNPLIRDCIGRMGGGEFVLTTRQYEVNGEMKNLLCFVGVNGGGAFIVGGRYGSDFEPVDIDSVNGTLAYNGCAYELRDEDSFVNYDIDNA